MTAAATIQVAHSLNRKGGLTTFRAVAVVTNAGCPGHHTHRLAVDDTAAEAEDRAIQYIIDTYLREDVDQPAEIIRHGRVPNIVLDTVAFLKSQEEMPLPC